MRDAFGELRLDGSAGLDEVMALYGGTALDLALRGRTVDEAMRSRLSARPVESDAVEIAGVRFTVRTVRNSRIVQGGNRSTSYEATAPAALTTAAARDIPASQALIVQLPEGQPDRHGHE